MAQAEKPREEVSARTLTAAFLALSFALSVAILANRNLYDDETSSSWIVTGSIRSILHFAATSDVHPPGMYLLAHLAWRILPSYRWMGLFPCIALYLGLAVFFFAVTPLFHGTRAQLLLLLPATLHPELLLWSNTFRWYSWWTGLALIVLTIALQPQTARPVLSARRAAVLGTLLAALFYINYITLLFAAALIVAMLVRYRAQSRGGLALSTLIVSGVFLLLSAHQLHIMIAVHLPGAENQRTHLLASAVRLAIAFSASEAYVPWHPLAVLAYLTFAYLCATGIVQFARRVRTTACEHSPLYALVVFDLLFCALAILSGLGGKPRSAMLLAPAFAPLAAMAGGRLSGWAQNALLGFLALWSGVGITHMLGRYGQAKSTMNDHPEQVVRFVREDAGGSCAIVATFDTGLTFTLAQDRLPNVVVFSAVNQELAHGSALAQASGCIPTRLYLVRSYWGGDNDWTRAIHAEQAAMQQLIDGPLQLHSFSPDPEAARKRQLARLPWVGGDVGNAAELPDYRFVVTSGPISPNQLTTLEHQAPEFAVVRLP